MLKSILLYCIIKDKQSKIPIAHNEEGTEIEGIWE